MPSLCHSIKSEYESLKQLKQEFVLRCDQSNGAGGSALLTTGIFDTLSKKDLDTLKRIKFNIETARDALREKFVFIFHVPNAINPYREALLESLIPDADIKALSVERKEMKWNLKDVLRKNQATYKSIGLHAWADNIATMDLTHLTPENRNTIEQEIEEGAIPIIMPDKATQLATTVDQFKKSFKPTWIEDGIEQQVKDAYLEWDHFINLITNKAQELVEGVPDHPYISMMCPTQRPDERTTNKTVDEQIQEFDLINTERTEKHQAPADILTLHEYGALQTIHSRLLEEAMPSVPWVLNPIDTETSTRFINLPLLSFAKVPCANWFKGNRQLWFYGDDAAFQYSTHGFRLAVRVKV